MLKLLPETIIDGRYQLTNELGSGGMATVYCAKDLIKESEVALKFLKPEQLNVERRRNRFLREFELLLALNHENIVKVFEQHDFGTEALFFSMELISGTSLEQIVKEAFAVAQTDKQAYIAKAIEYLKQLAEALNYLHTQGVIFCDLKPANVVIDAGQDKAKLLDFGIAIKEAEQQDSGENSKMLGTSLYMSPEQIRSEKLTASSDIYSFGVLAFEVLTGSVPYAQENLFGVTASHLIAKVPSARALNKAVPESLDIMLQICLEKKAEDRYQSFSEIIRSLAKIDVGNSKSKKWISRLFGF